MSESVQGRENDFILVKGRNGRRNKSTFSDLITKNDTNKMTPATDNNHPSPETVIRRIKAAIDHLKETDYFESFYKVLLQSLEELGFPGPEPLAKNDNPESAEETIKIVCYGLGTFSDCMIARYQLGFLILLREKLKTSAQVELFDPVFTSQEKEILLNEFGFVVLSENEEGKRRVDDMTLFYLPHCSHQLVNNLLYSNWSPERLKYCIIVSNSFINIRESLPPRLLSESLTFIDGAKTVSAEYGVVNCFQFPDIFNDTAIHVFPSSKLNLIDEDFWLDKELPVYSNLDFVSVKKSSGK